MPQCPECNQPNEPNFKFCGACGTALGLPPEGTWRECPRCKVQNESYLKFCGECGAPLPVAESSSEQVDDRVGAPSYRLFDNISVFIATFFGGPLAGAILMARNYSRFGDQAAVVRTVFAGVVATGLLLAIGNLVPSGLQLPLAVSALAAITGIARALQGAAVEKHVRLGGRIASRWLAFGIGVGVGAALLLGIYAVANAG
jgi:hypothetical protein